MDPGQSAADGKTPTGTANELPIFALSRAVSPLDLPHADFITALERRSANRRAFLDWVDSHLSEGVDYGRIHVAKRDRCSDAACSYARNPRHWSKPNMFKPGAEKVANALGIRPIFPAFADYERAALDGRVIAQIVLRCRLEDGAGNCFAEGIGARSVEDDFGDLNKSLKMGAKSAQVDAVLRLGGLSEIFTQGLEDLPAAKLAELADHPDERAAALSGIPPLPAPQHENRPAPTPQHVSAPVAPLSQPRNVPTVSEAQVKLLYVKLDRAGVMERDLLAKFDIATIEELPRKQMDAALAWIASLGGQ